MFSLVHLKGLVVGACCLSCLVTKWRARSQENHLYTERITRYHQTLHRILTNASFQASI